MACTKPHDLVAFAKQELTGREAETARVHVAGCADCGAEAKRLDSLFSRFRNLRANPVEASGDFAWRVRAALTDANPELLRRRPVEEPRRGLLPTWALAGVFAALMIAILSVSVILQNPSSGSDDSHMVKITPPTPSRAPAAFHSPRVTREAMDIVPVVHAALVAGDSGLLQAWTVSQDDLRGIVKDEGAIATYGDWTARVLREAGEGWDFAGSKVVEVIAGKLTTVETLGRKRLQIQTTEGITGARFRISLADGGSLWVDLGTLVKVGGRWKMDQGLSTGKK